MWRKRGQDLEAIIEKEKPALSDAVEEFVSALGDDMLSELDEFIHSRNPRVRSSLSFLCEAHPLQCNVM